MSLGSGTIPLDWYSKSQQAMLVHLDQLYQDVLNDSTHNLTGMSSRQGVVLLKKQAERFSKINTLRKKIGFIS